MIRLEGLSRDALKIREDVFEGLVRKSVRMAVRAFSANLNGVLIAAATPATPTLAAEPPPPVPTLTGAELSVVTATWGAHVTSELYPYLAQTYLDAAAATLGAVENATSITLAAVTDPLAVDYLRGAANRLRGIGDVVWDAVRQELALGYAAGDDIHQLATRVRAAANVSTPRALIIARTEVVSAANAGSLTQVQLGGFTDEECQKEWLATDDTRTRPAHREADGQRVGINQAFSVGGDYLQVPGDRTGRPDNVIGCRCSVAFVFDDDDDIVADVDEPLTAAKKQWTAADEAKVKRDSEGKFAKKAGSGVASGGQPIKINTKTVYQTKYTDGQVVAIKATNFAKTRLIWSESKKKFELQRKKPGIGNWETKNSYTKAETLTFFKDQSGWETPKVTDTPATPSLKSLAADQVAATPTNPPSSTTPPTITSPKPIHINTNVIYKQKYADGAVIAEKADSVYGNMRLTWSESKKKFELQGQLPDGSWDTAEVYGKGEAYKKFSQETGWQEPGSLSTPTATPSLPTAADVVVIDDDDIDDITSLTYEDLTKSVAKQANTMSAAAFSNWFNLNKSEIKKLWSDLDDDSKISMIDAAEGHEIETGDSTIFDLIKSWTPGKLNAPKVTGITPTFLGPKNDDPINVMAWADWVSTGFEKSVWDSLTEQQKNDMTLAAAKAHAMGLPQALAKIKQFDGKTSSLPGGLNSVDEYNGLTTDKKHEWIKNLTKADWNSLTPDQQADIFEFTEDENATWGGLDDAMAILNLFKNKSTSTSITTSSPASIVGTPVEPTPIHALDAVEKAMSVKFVGDIGTPKTKVSYWQELTVDTTKAMQEKMLGGDTWTGPQVGAVAKYTTSEGYQTMNAVLRNDVKQLKKFNGPQLNSAVTSAKHLQSAMRPLTESVILHRGTGAHAFGFDSINVSTDELKKLQGKVIVDKGFVSTSVVAPTHISFDYAKKPIKVIVQAPEGTPALYVSAATPGYSHENELILGAGSSFHVNEVRAASAADKAQYGSHTEQVVTVTVVPSVKPGASTAPTVTPSVTTPITLTPSAPTIPGPPPTGGGAPLKINTNTIYKQTYAHGAVIAVKPGHKTIDGKARRLFWNEHLKKFVLQQEIAPGNWVGSLPDGKYTFNKKDAYATFSKEGDWETPPTGMSALVTTTGPVTLPPSPTLVPNVSTTATPTPSAAAPKLKSVKAGVKLPKLDADALQSQAGMIPTALTIDQRSGLYKKFKSFPDTGLTHSADAAFGALYETLNWHNETSTQPTQLNMLQLINVLDEQAAFYAKVTNEGALAKKIVTWLKTPAGQRFAHGIVAPSSTVSLKTPGVIDHPVVSKIGQKAKEILKGLKDPNSIGTINTAATDFKPSTMAEAQAHASQAMLPPEQKSAITSYTSSSLNINLVLRGPGTGSIHADESAARNAVLIQNAMRPSKKSVILYRGTDPDQFPGLTYGSGFEDIKKFEGNVIRDRAFLSTSIDESSSFSNKKIKLEIEAPEGTPMMFVKSWSSWPHENEMLLAAGLKYHVVSVTKHGSQTKVRLRVVP